MTEMFTQEFWNERYSSKDQLWSGRPNSRLVEYASGLQAGSALDVGSGEGADAIWLAEKGWRVTALDVSTVALERGSARAAEVGPEVVERIDWLHKDLLAWEGPEPRSYDLVSAHYMHLPKEARQELFGRLASAVSVGGTLLIVGHDPADLPDHAPPGMDACRFTPSEVAMYLEPREEWEIVIAASLARATADHGHHHHRDAVLLARRRL